MKKSSETKLVFAGLFIAIGLLLSTTFHMLDLPEFRFLPVHIPVILCGLVSGSMLGGLTGLLIPLLSSIFSGTPMLYPIGVCMMLELSAYGIISGALSSKTNIFVVLIIAMLGGRFVRAIAQIVILEFDFEAFVVSVFFTEAFVTALPGIIIQLVLIPLLMLTLKKTKLLPIKL